MYVLLYMFKSLSNTVYLLYLHINNKANTCKQWMYYIQYVITVFELTHLFNRLRDKKYIHIFIELPIYIYRCKKRISISHLFSNGGNSINLPYQIKKPYSISH